MKLSLSSLISKYSRFRVFRLSVLKCTPYPISILFSISNNAANFVSPVGLYTATGRISLKLSLT